MDGLWRDLRFAFRGLLRTPGFTLAAALALALGIGATTAIFSVVHAVLLRSMGWGDESGLLAVHSDFPGHRLFNVGISPPEYADLVASGIFAEVGAEDTGTSTVQGTPVERVRAGLVTSGFFRALRVQAQYGRTFVAQEDVEGSDRVAILSAPYFRRRFGGDASIVGRTVTMDGVPRTVVGVLPEAFRFGPQQEVYLPFGWSPATFIEARTLHSYLGVVRLKPGMTVDGARAALAALTQRVRSQHPDLYSKEAAWRFSAQPLRTEFSGPARDPLVLLLGAVALVLLIACANVANLLLARSAARAKEFAVRAALGADRARIVRQLLTESGLLALIGAAAGVAIAAWSMEALLASAPPGIRDLAETRLHGPVLLFAAGLSIATTLLFGLVPALRASDPDLATSMKEGAATAAPAAVRARAMVISAQVALSFVLLVASGLVLRSFAQVLAVAPGFDADHVITAHLAPGGPDYDDKPEARRRYFAQAERAVAALPGVTEAGAINVLPLNGRAPRSYLIEDYQPGPGEPQPVSQIRWVEGSYFAALRIPVVQGRALGAADDARAPAVALVNEAWARRYFPGREVLGKRIELAVARSTDGVKRTVVGVVKDQHDLGLDAPAEPTFYLPQEQGQAFEMTIAARVEGDPASLGASVAQAVLSIDPGQPPDDVRPFTEVVSGSLAPRRFPLELLGGFGALALILSALGIYGITAYAVAQRTREIGVRMAIGATAGGVVRMVLSGALRTVAAGLAAGALGALAVGRAISSQLYGVSARDPLTFVAIAALLGAVTLLASGLPALRAAKVDPISALRAE
ncbi:MAG TPA: ABC transporter permease [Myxococcales bacterium]|nr:ABC transporter permease [Myxococcales bacterium]